MENRTQIEQARWRVLQEFPFFARLVLRMPLVATPEVELAAVDRHGRLYYHPEAFARLSEKDQAGVVLHELLHLAFQHFERAKVTGVGAGNLQRWNQAADLEINPVVIRTFRLPPGALFPRRFGLPENLLAEEYYAKLPGVEEPEQGGDASRPPRDGDQPDPNESPPLSRMGSSGSAADGEPRPWELPADDPDRPALSDELIDALVQDAAREYERSHRSGYGPFSARAFIEWAERTLPPAQVDWRNKLRRWIQRGLRVSGADDYTFRRLRRRGRVILPRTDARRGRLALVIDTSASMGQEDFTKVLAEVKAILHLAEDARYFAVDTQVTAEGPVRNLRQIELRGGGATDMAVGIRAARERGYEHVIVLTDGGTAWPPAPEEGERVLAVLTQPAGFYTPPPRWIETVHLA